MQQFTNHSAKFHQLSPALILPQHFYPSCATPVHWHQAMIDYDTEHDWQWPKNKEVRWVMPMKGLSNCWDRCHPLGVVGYPRLQPLGCHRYHAGNGADHQLSPWFVPVTGMWAWHMFTQAVFQHRLALASPISWVSKKTSSRCEDGAQDFAHRRSPTPLVSEIHGVSGKDRWYMKSFVFKKAQSAET